jgi:site-specific DNA-methyltransferase (adenine-specific)
MSYPAKKSRKPSAPPVSFLDGRVVLRPGDCLDVLDDMDENSVDAVVCDPPYHLTSIVKRFGAAGAAEAKSGKTGAFKRASTGFMGKKWDGGDVAFRVETWAKVLRVLKPGGYLVAFSSSRTFGRMSVAIEDAGFITHPMFGWIFGSGFPKAHRVHAEGYEGFRYGGQATKPALEPIYMGQKPFSEVNGTANVLLWGTGALNIDECRVHADDAKGYAYTVKRTAPGAVQNATGQTKFEDGTTFSGETKDGRWPANVIHDGSAEVLAAFPEAPGQQADASSSSSRKTQNVYGAMKRGNGREGEPSADRRYADQGATNFAALPGQRRGDEGSAARFFYTAKADADDRLGSKHPTVKPLDLMQYLVRLVTPPGGLVLDPFAGTGTTGEAAWREGMRAVLIERETEYQADIARRMELAASPTKRAAVAKSKNRLLGAEGTPLFDGAA